MSRRATLGRLFASYACGAVATGLPWPLLLVLVWDRYGAGPDGALIVGLAGAARMAPYVLLSWVAGCLGDRLDRGRVVLTTLALRSGLLTLAAISVALGHLGWTVALAALAVTAGVPAYPCLGAALPFLAGPDRDRATDVLVTVEVSAWVIGPALGGLLLASEARAWTLTIAAGLALVGRLLMTGIDLPAVEAGDAPRGVVTTLSTVLASPRAVGALGLALLLNLVETTTAMVLLPLSQEVWRQGDHGYGLAVACLGLGALAAPLLSRRVGGRGLPLLGGLVVLVAVSPSAEVALPLLAATGAVGVLVEGRVTRTLQDAVPDHCRAGALGLADTVMVTACLAGTVAAPALARLAGGRTTLVVAAAACVLPAAVALLTAGPRVRSTAQSPREAVPATAYDAPGERARPDPRGTPAVGGARVG